jgi:hypothetical protein
MAMQSEPTAMEWLRKVEEALVEPVRECSSIMDAPDSLQNVADDPEVDPEVREVALRLVQEWQAHPDASAEARSVLLAHALRVEADRLSSPGELGVNVALDPAVSSAGATLLLVKLVSAMTAGQRKQEAAALFELLRERIGSEVVSSLADRLRRAGVPLEFSRTWLVREARRSISELLREVRGGRPQIIAGGRGEDPAIVIGVSQLADLLEITARPTSLDDIRARHPEIRPVEQRLLFRIPDEPQPVYRIPTAVRARERS